MECPNMKKNLEDCNCTYPCDKKGKCCECINTIEKETNCQHATLIIKLKNNMIEVLRISAKIMQSLTSYNKGL